MASERAGSEIHGWLLGSRLNSLRGGPGPRRSVPEAIDALAGIDGIGALELNYPQHFTDRDATLAAIGRSGLPLTTLNLRYDPPTFALGAFTNPDPAIRREAIRVTLDAASAARELGAGHLILWMGPDGWDLPMQADYATLWNWEVSGISAVAAENPDLRFSIEYKPGDPRRYSLIRGMPDALLAARDTGQPNVGVTLDLCHALMAGEHPPASAALALREGKLFGVHINDGYGPADDGLMVGTVHPWVTLELLLVLQRGGYDGTLYFDTFPELADPVRECQSNVRLVRALEGVLARTDLAAIAEGQAAQDPFTIVSLIEAVLNGGG